MSGFLGNWGGKVPEGITTWGFTNSSPGTPVSLQFSLSKCQAMAFQWMWKSKSDEQR